MFRKIVRMHPSEPKSDPVVGVDYHAPQRNPRRMLYLIAGVAAAVVIVARAPHASLFEKPQPVVRPVLVLPATSTAPSTQPEPTGPTVAEVRRIAAERVLPALDQADRDGQAAVADHLRALDDFFIQAKRNTPGFAKAVLGWSSKWRLVSDKLPFTRTDRHAQFLRKTFHDRLFTPEALTKVVEQTVGGYGGSMAGIENRMLVRIRADVSDLPPAMLPAFNDDAALRAAFERALAQATQRIGADLKADVGRETTSLVAGEVMTLVAVRLGVSAGILSAGAGSSWATFGVGAVVGLVVDQAVTWVWNWWRDPVGDLSTKMRGKLEDIRVLIIEGDGKQPGLRGRLEAVARDRAAVRRAAVLRMIQSPEEAKP
jgi:hypothetical protein